MKNSHTKHHTILWADDDPDDLMMMRDVLQSANEDHHTIVEVDNGQKVLDYLHQAAQTGRFPCLVVLDMNMPVLSGKETLIRIKADQNLASIPVVIFTTSAGEPDKSFCQRYGVEMITKPPTFASFKEVVHRLLNICASSSAAA